MPALVETELAFAPFVMIAQSMLPESSMMTSTFASALTASSRGTFARLKLNTTSPAGGGGGGGAAAVTLTSPYNRARHPDAVEQPDDERVAADERRVRHIEERTVRLQTERRAGETHADRIQAQCPESP